jgi:hypothetical protein
VTSVPFDTAAFCAYFHDFYEALPDYVVVGHFPFDHSAQYLQQLYAATQSPPAEVLQLNNQVVRWRTAGGQGVTDIKKVGRELRLQPFGEPSAAPVRALWATLFKTPMPQLIPDSPILQCVIPAARIRCRTKQFWKRCVQLYRASGIEYMREHMYNVCDGVNTHTSMDFCTAYAWENIWASLFEPGVEAWQDFRVD